MLENKMATKPINQLVWELGLPMIISMILQALYNVIDSIFVSNIESIGSLANEALTYAFPIQILIIALGVGTGVGLNTLLSKSLGEKNQELANKIVGNGIILGIIIYIIFLIFGLFCSKWFISLFTSNQEVIEMGSDYLKICSCLSIGSIGFTIYERFLQSTGKTHYSTIAQISGAVINVILDYIFIYPLNMGVIGAAYATVIGQIVSMIIAMYFHYFKNKEIKNNIKYLKLDITIIKKIYSIGISAALMQGMLSIMMAGMNIILGNANENPTILVGAFGIYYKIQQIALFSCFGLSNTIITLLSFNYGMNDKTRAKECIKYGIINTIIVSLIITILFEITARPLSLLFSITNKEEALINVCETATRIAAIGYVFMGISVAIQGVLQALRYLFKPLISASLRLIIFIFPLAYLFTLLPNTINIVWWAFPISELLTFLISIGMLNRVYKEKF